MKFISMAVLPIPSRHNSLPLVVGLLLGFFAPAPATAAETHPRDEKDATAILQAICPNRIRREVLKKGLAYGCGGCPSFTGFAGQPPSQGNYPDLELRNVLKGSFTRPGANEALVEFFGCEPHAANFGGTMLLENVGEKWRRIRYAEGVIGILRTYATKGGRDLVLAQGGYTGQGTSTGWICTYDFSVRPDPAEQTLLKVEDTSGDACQMDRVSLGYIEELEFPDLNGDGQPDLQVKVRWGQALVPARLRRKCDGEFKPPKPPTYVIDFIFDGKTFRVAPGSAAVLSKVEAKD